MKPPRKDELRSAAKVLTMEATKYRNYADENDKLAATRRESGREENAKWLEDDAIKKRKKADVWEKVAAWMTTPANKTVDGE